jgi:hypothetical protein
VPKYTRDIKQGFWANFVNEFNHFRNEVAPTANSLLRQTAADQVLPHDVESVRRAQTII